MDPEAGQESLDVVFHMSNILETGLDRNTLSILIALYDMGPNVESLAAMVKELHLLHLLHNFSDLMQKCAGSKVNGLHIYVSGLPYTRYLCATEYKDEHDQCSKWWSRRGGRQSSKTSTHEAAVLGGPNYTAVSMRLKRVEAAGRRSRRMEAVNIFKL